MTDCSTTLSIRIDFAEGRLAPGKAALLRTIAETGSISATARSMGMSYARAWSLAESMNSCFKQRLVATFAGGNQRGGARLAKSGQKVMPLYDRISVKSRRAVAPELASVQALCK